MSQDCVFEDEDEYEYKYDRFAGFHLAIRLTACYLKPFPRMGSAPTRCYELLVQLGGKRFTRCLLRPGGIYRVGQSRENAIVVDEESVSGQHALLKVSRRGAVRVQDLGSANGTFVNGEFAGEPCRVKPGSTLQFGACPARIEIKDVWPK